MHGVTEAIVFLALTQNKMANRLDYSPAQEILLSVHHEKGL